MDKTNKIIHKRSSVILENGKAKLPTTDQLEYGELAINFAKGAETISFKNNNDEIVSITTSAALEGIIESNMQNVQASIDAINQTIEENEEIVATALTNLDERIKSTVEVIDGIQKENDTLEDRIDTKLAGKVDRDTVDAIDDRLTELEEERMKIQTVTGSAPTISTLEENTYYICTSAVNRLTMTNFQNNTDKPVAHYKVFFTISSTSSTIVFPSGITWAHGEVPVINDTSFSYELDIEKITYNNTTSYRGILVKFK